MKIDLSKAVRGDEFELRGGNVAIFVGYYGDGQFPYNCTIDEQLCSYKQDGSYISATEHALDIVKALPKESIEDNVCSKIQERKALGLEKYGTTMERTDLSIDEWLTHAQEEAMDLSIYLEKIKSEIALIRK